MIRVLIADDHYLVRQGIHALLEQAPDIKVVGEASDGEEVVDLATSLKPDVVVMDISMPKQDGIAATTKLHEVLSQPRVIVLSMYSNSSLVERALRNGACGYLLKRSAARELVQAVHAAHQGHLFLGANLSLDNPNLDRLVSSRPS